MIELPLLANIDRARRSVRVPVVLTRDEAHRVMEQLHGTAWLAVNLLYGSGLRLLECVTLRVKDVDFAYNQITVRDGKGRKDRRTLLPTTLRKSLQRHLGVVKTLHERDLAAGFGRAPLPFALARKYPSANTEWGWQFVFPSAIRVAAAVY